MSTTITPPKPCGHTRHVGTCPACQREMSARHDAQLAQATAYGRSHPALAARG